MAHAAVIRCYWGAITQFYVIRNHTDLASAPNDKWPKSDISPMSQSNWEALVKPAFEAICISAFSRLDCMLNVCQPAFITVWVSFSISEESALQSSINIRCDQTARNSKQTAETCRDVFFLKCHSVRAWENHGGVCLICSLRGKCLSKFPSICLSASSTVHCKQMKTGIRMLLVGSCTKQSKKTSVFVYDHFLSNRSMTGKQIALVRFYKIKPANTLLQTTTMSFDLVCICLWEKIKSSHRFVLFASVCYLKGNLYLLKSLEETIKSCQRC